MRVSPPSLLPLLRSDVQGKVLATVYLSPGREFSVTELARLAHASFKATAQEVDRLVTSGFLVARRSGNQRLLQRPEPDRIVTPLTQLLAATYGPLPVLSQELDGVEGIGEAFIYGSWAARDAGVAGPPPNDVDVLVLGPVALDVLDQVAERSAARLHCAVNIRRLPVEYWENPPENDSFVATVKRQPLAKIPMRRNGGDSEMGTGQGSH